VKHLTHPTFWKHFDQLRPEVQEAANKNFALLKADPKHPSLKFKRIKKYWSVRVNIDHRALAIEAEDCYVWFWIGGHSEYDRIVDAQRK
jgi:hypothetical protein